MKTRTRPSSSATNGGHLNLTETQQHNIVIKVFVCTLHRKRACYWHFLWSPVLYRGKLFNQSGPKPKIILEILIHAFITNKLDYCDSLLTGLPKYLIKRIPPVQNAAARLVSGSKKHDHITPILHELHGLPVERRVTYKILPTTFKCLNNLTPSFLPDLIIQFKPKQTLRSSSKNLLVIPRTNTIRYGERAFCAVAPGLWMIFHYT